MNEIDSENLVQDRSHKIRIILATVYPLMMQALQTYIGNQQDMEIVAETRDGEEAIELSAKLIPDVIIINADMPACSGLETTQRIVAQFPGIKVLLLTLRDNKSDLLEMQRAGASGYFTIFTPGEALVHIVRVIADGKSVFPQPNVQENTLSEVRGTKSQVPDKSKALSLKELTILKLVAKGLSNKNIAVRLELSQHYVKANLTTIFMKMNVSSRTEAVSTGLRNGILMLNDLNS